MRTIPSAIFGLALAATLSVASVQAEDGDTVLKLNTMEMTIPAEMVQAKRTARDTGVIAIFRRLSGAAEQTSEWLIVMERDTPGRGDAAEMMLGFHDRYRTKCGRHDIRDYKDEGIQGLDPRDSYVLSLCEDFSSTELETVDHGLKHEFTAHRVLVQNGRLYAIRYIRAGNDAMGPHLAETDHFLTVINPMMQSVKIAP